MVVFKGHVAAFIDWARSQVEGYAEIFRNQVYSSGVEVKVVEEALKITYDLSKKVIVRHTRFLRLANIEFWKAS